MMLNSTANMYPWYRDSMTQLGQFCGAAAAHAHAAHAAAAHAHIKTENGYGGGGNASSVSNAGNGGNNGDCMLALDYAQSKVGDEFYRNLLRELKRSSFFFFPTFSYGKPPVGELAGSEREEWGGVEGKHPSFFQPSLCRSARR